MTDQTTPITYSVITTAFDTTEYAWSSEKEMRDWLDANLARTNEDPRPVALFRDAEDDDARHMRDLGWIIYRPGKKFWTLTKRSGLTTEDHFAIANILRRFKASPPWEPGEMWRPLEGKDGVTRLFAPICRPVGDLTMAELFEVDLPSETRSPDAYLDYTSDGETRISPQDVTFALECFDPDDEPIRDPRPVEVFECPRTGQLMRRIGASRYDQATSRFTVVTFDGATDRDAATIWWAPGLALEDIQIGADAAAATTLHTRPDGTRYAETIIARPLSDLTDAEIASLIQPNRPKEPTMPSIRNDEMHRYLHTDDDQTVEVFVEAPFPGSDAEPTVVLRDPAS